MSKKQNTRKRLPSRLFRERSSKKPRRRIPRTADDFFASREEFQTDYEDTLRVISKMRSDGLSLKKAAKQEGVNPLTVTELGRQALKKRANRSYAVSKRDSLFRPMKIITPYGPREIALRNSRQASILGRYWDAVHKALNGDASKVAKFKGKSITDMYDVKFPLITNLDELKRLGYAGVLSFESIYARVA